MTLRSRPPGLSSVARFDNNEPEQGSVLGGAKNLSSMSPVGTSSQEGCYYLSEAPPEDFDLMTFRQTFENLIMK